MTDKLVQRWTPDLSVCDAHGRVKHKGADDTTVGDRGYDRQCEDSNGAMLRDLATVNGLCITNTVLAAEEDYTFISSCGERSRIDYILASEEWSAHVTGTWVDHDFDHGLRKDDHFPLIASITAAYLPDPRKRTQGFKLDPQKLRDEELLASFRAELAALRPPQWEMDVNDQYRVTVGEVSEIARKHFAKDLLSPIQPYISRHTMRLIRLRRYALSALRQWRCGRAEAFDNLCVYLPGQHAFYVQQGDIRMVEGQNLLLAVQLLDAGDATVTETGRRVHDFVQRTKAMVRERLAADRAHHIDTMGARLAETVEAKDSQAEWSLVKKVLRYTGRPPKKFSGDHLPLRRDERGEIIQSKEELAEEQLQHFGRIEDAVLLSDITSMARVYNDRGNDSTKYAALSLEDVPSRYELEQTFRKMQQGKAPGPDGLAGELFSRARTGAYCWPILSPSATSSSSDAEWARCWTCCSETARLVGGQGAVRPWAPTRSGPSSTTPGPLARAASSSLWA